MDVPSTACGPNSTADQRTQPKPTASTAKTGPGSRASLACLPCRSRHIRCDAGKPTCERCAAENKTCVYAKSRRGGLDRAALAALAARQQKAVPAENLSQAPCQDHGQIQSQPPAFARPSIDGISSLPPSWEYVESSASSSFQPSQMRGLGSPDTATSAALDPTPQHLLRTASTSPLPVDLYSMDIAGDAFIGRYYKCFHRCHPCVLPRKYLERMVRSSPPSAALKALLSVLKYMGSFYSSSAHQSMPGGSLSEQLREIALTAISEAESASPASSSSSSIWLLAQSHLIYSIGQYWRSNSAESRHHLDAAIRLVLEFRMYQWEFADEHGQGDPVLQECLRRTWWQIYIVDGSHAAIQRRNVFALRSIYPTAELPCEEDEYESENIPPPKSLEQFNAREFAPDNIHFSSFAYLIGAMRTMATAITRAHAITSVSSECSPGARSPKFLEEVDALIRGWLLLVPESKSHFFTKNGDMDELLFYAFMALYASKAGLNRAFSECHVNPLEDMSSCSSPHVKECQARGFDLSELSPFTRVHTAICIEAAEAQIRMLSFPVPPTSHSPFTICMLTTGTLSLLAACKFILRGERLAVARDQIRASIGYHRAMASVWPQAKTNLQEIQEIARNVLAIDAANGDVQNEASRQNSITSIQSVQGGDELAASAVNNGFFLAVAQGPSLPTVDAQIWSANDVQVPMDLACWWTGEPEMMNS